MHTRYVGHCFGYESGHRVMIVVMAGNCLPVKFDDKKCAAIPKDNCSNGLALPK